jgi:hypothetical protein
VYRDGRGNLVLVPPKNITRSSRGNSNPKTGNKAKKETRVKGRQVSFRQSAADAVCVYGTTRLGGVYTYLNTGERSRAFLRTGEEDSQIVWIAREKGASGNEISVEFVLGAEGHTSVEVTEKAIKVLMRFSNAQSRSTANAIITAVRNNQAAHALVSCHKGEGKGNSYVEPADPQFLQEGGGARLHHFITIAGHEITAVDKLYLDDREVTFGASPDPRWALGIFQKRVFMAVQYGTPDQEAQQDLVAYVGEDAWSQDHRQRGCAGAYIMTRWAAGLFANGIPDVEFLVRGKKCLDFRDSQTKFTANAALVLADFLCDSKFGPGIPREYLNTANWTAAANICDEQVTTPAGENRARYEINGYFDTGASVQNIIDEMLQAMAGDLVYQGGEWFCYPAKWRAPTWSLTEADFRGEPKITTAVPRRQRFNAVRGKFADREKKFVETDYKSVTNNYYAEQDGQVIFEDIPQPFLTDGFQARRVARIELERVRQGMEVDVTLGAEALKLAVCDTLQLTYVRLGWEQKAFEVRDIQIGDMVDGGLEVQVKLRETAEAIYTWTTEETETDLAPDTQLPSPYDVLPPTNLTLTSGTAELYVRNDGTVFSRLKVSWIKPEDQFVTEGGSYEIQYKKSSASSYISASSVDGDQSEAYILDVQDGELHDVRIRSVNTLRVPGEFVEATGHLVLGKSEPPSTPSNFSATVFDGGILFQWSKVTDLDVREYEVRIGESWDSAIPLARIGSTSYSTARRSAGSYKALLKAIDTSGNYSQVATAATFTVNAPSAPIASFFILGTDVILSWTAASGSFPIDSYILKTGTSFESAVTVAEVKALNFSKRANWGGDRAFFVQGVDVAGNVGAPGQIVAHIQIPNAPLAFAADVVDNNVMLRWAAPPLSSLPLAQYEVRRGNVYLSAEPLGTTSSTFSPRFELESGTFTYWVAAVDTAGNVSTPSSVTAKVDQPPDFQFFGRYDFAFAGASVGPSGNSCAITDGAIITDTSLLLPTSHETWSDHFASHGWDSLQEQIGDGYEYLIHPTDTTGSVEVTRDFGALVTSSVLTVSYQKTPLSGSVILTPTLSTSADGVSWTSYTPGNTRVFASNVRWIKILFEAVGTTDEGLALLENVTASLGVKEGTVSGADETASSGANLGRKQIDITGEFCDVRSITITPGYNPSFGVVAVYDFLDVPNPTGFTVYTYRADTGSVVGGVPFSYIVRGYVA